MANIDDKEWLDLLSGKVVNAQDEAQIKAASTLRSVIKKFNAEETAQSEGLKKLNLRMASEGLFIEPSEMSFSKKIKSVFKKIRLIIIFIIGLVAGLMIPMQIATRGGSEHLLNFQLPTMTDSKVETEVVIHASESNKTTILKAQEITLSAISVGLSVTTEKQSDAIHLTINGFTKMNPDLVPINSVLGLSNRTQGNVSVLILK